MVVVAVCKRLSVCVEVLRTSGSPYIPFTVLPPDPRSFRLVKISRSSSVGFKLRSPPSDSLRWSMPSRACRGSGLAPSARLKVGRSWQPRLNGESAGKNCASSPGRPQFRLHRLQSHFSPCAEANSSSNSDSLRCGTETAHNREAMAHVSAHAALLGLVVRRAAKVLGEGELLLPDRIHEGIVHAIGAEHVGAGCCPGAAMGGCWTVDVFKSVGSY